MFSIMKIVGHNFVELKFFYEIIFFYLTISLYLLFSCPEQISWLHHCFSLKISLQIIQLDCFLWQSSKASLNVVSLSTKSSPDNEVRPFGLKVPEAIPRCRVLHKSLCTAHVLLTKNFPSYPQALCL